VQIKANLDYKNLLAEINRVAQEASFKVTDPDLLKAMSTMRKLPLFGLLNSPVDFEYPTEKDLALMPLDQPIKLSGFCYKRSTASMRRFGAIQLNY